MIVVIGRKPNNERKSYSLFLDSVSVFLRLVQVKISNLGLSSCSGILNAIATRIREEWQATRRPGNGCVTTKGNVCDHFFLICFSVLQTSTTSPLNVWYRTDAMIVSRETFAQMLQPLTGFALRILNARQTPIPFGLLGRLRFALLLKPNSVCKVD
jgi:hypothetical protein